MAVVNGALDAAMAALKAQPYPWFLPAYSIRLTDQTVYNSLVATYGFGSPLIIGLSPTAAAALTGVTINRVATYAAQTMNPQIYVDPSASNVLGVPVSLSDSGGTIFISYATPYGRSDRVVWQWQCDVEFNPVTVPIDAGTYQQQVVQWTGDGTSGRLIPTSFALDTGVVAIWICGIGSDVNICRMNHAAMLGTAVMGLGLDPITTSGIMSFTASGFTVTPGTTFGNGYANTTGHLYSAIVMRDTTQDNRYLQTGRYTGNGSAGHQIFTSGAVVPITHLWVWQRGVAYASSDFGGAVSLASEAYPTADVVTGLGNGNFVLGSQNNTNNNGSHYDYLALCVDARFTAQHIFASFIAAGTASPPVVVALPFTPGLTFGRWFTTLAAGGYWRGLDHTGTDSAVCQTTAGFNDEPLQGIVAMGASSASFGTFIAVNGSNFVGWAFVTGSIPAPGTPAPYTPVVVPAGAYVPDGGLLAGAGLGAGTLGPCGD